MAPSHEHAGRRRRPSRDSSPSERRISTAFSASVRPASASGDHHKPGSDRDPELRLHAHLTCCPARPYHRSLSWVRAFSLGPPPMTPTRTGKPRPRAMPALISLRGPTSCCRGAVWVNRSGDRGSLLPWVAGIASALARLSLVSGLEHSAFDAVLATTASLRRKAVSAGPGPRVLPY